MDDDTIFPAVSLGEEVLGKYRDSIHCGQLEIIGLLINLRLLLRWKIHTCIFFSRSHYSSINLRSIHRIDEMPSNPYWFLIFLQLGLFVLGLCFLILGPLTTETAGPLIACGILSVISSIILCVFIFFFYGRKYIHLKGTFGTIVLKFPIDTARELQARLSEMIYQRKMKRTLQQIKYQQQSYLQPPPLISTPMYFSGNEKQSSKVPSQYTNN